jgi:hypothetical protein
VGTTLVEVGGVKTEMVEHTRTYGPTQRSWRRVEALRLSVDIDPDDLARHIVRAVRRGRSAICYPRRSRPFPVLGHAPWRITELLLLGVDRHRDDGIEGTEPGGTQ